jgi:hypothetical protein
MQERTLIDGTERPTNDSGTEPDDEQDDRASDLHSQLANSFVGLLKVFQNISKNNPCCTRPRGVFH